MSFRYILCALIHHYFCFSSKVLRGAFAGKALHRFFDEKSVGEKCFGRFGPMPPMGSQPEFARQVQRDASDTDKGSVEER